MGKKKTGKKNGTAWLAPIMFNARVVCDNKQKFVRDYSFNSSFVYLYMVINRYFEPQGFFDLSVYHLTAGGIGNFWLVGRSGVSVIVNKPINSVYPCINGT